MGRFDSTERMLTFGVVGTGVMGRGIMQVAATAGFRVVAYDTRVGAADEAKASVTRSLAKLVEKGRMHSEAAVSAEQAIEIARHIEGFSRCDVIVEAVVERLDVKQELVSALDGIASADCIIATNTSSLSVTAIAARCRHPERVAGFHFFNPVPVMRLVEVIPGIKTRKSVVARLVEVGRRMGREPIVVSDSPGFLVNHVGRAYMPEALRILNEGVAEARDIDLIMREAAGFKMGPFELLDLVGVDVAHAVMESLHGQFFGDPIYAPSVITSRRVAAGMLGRKCGEGFYRYDKGKLIAPPPVPVPKALVRSVWVSPNETEGYRVVRSLLSDLGVAVEESERPSKHGLCIVTPIGQDATSATTAQGLDARRTVAVDTLFPVARHRTVMRTPVTTAEYVDSAHALFATDGATVSVINDSAGFVAQRIVAMLVNIGCHIAQLRLATPDDIDRASKEGLNYPFGPLEFGDNIGCRRVLKIVERLHSSYGDARYRPSVWLRRRAALDASLLTPDAPPDPAREALDRDLQT